MKNKNKFVTLGIILTTLVLAGIAIFTAIRLYQTRYTAVAPNAPESKPNASGSVCGGIAGTLCATGEVCVYSDGKNVPPTADATGVCAPTSRNLAAGSCSLTFTLSSSPTPTSTATATATTTSKSSSSPTPTSTATATATVTASPNPQCNNSCTSNSGCPSGLMCYIASGQTAGNCRNTQCLSETDCSCNVATTTPTSTTNSTNKPTAQPSLPNAGTSWPTVLGTGFGIMVIIGSLLLAL